MCMYVCIMLDMIYVCSSLVGITQLLAVAAKKALFFALRWLVLALRYLYVTQLSGAVAE